MAELYKPLKIGAKQIIRKIQVFSVENPEKKCQLQEVPSDINKADPSAEGWGRIAETVGNRFLSPVLSNIYRFQILGVRTEIAQEFHH